MNSLRSVVKRHPIATFVLLSYLLSWWPAFLPQGGLLPHGPLFAALIVVGLGEGRSALSAWWKQAMRFRTSWVWYVVAILIPGGIALTAAGINVMLGADVISPVDWTIPLQVLPIMLVLSGMWEEPGWTGYLLPALYNRFGTTTSGILLATLVTGLIRSGWHLPLVLSGSVYWTDLIFIFAFQLVFTWLFNQSGSVPVIMLSHLTSNIIGGELVGSMFEGADWAREAWLRGALWVIVAIVLLLATRGRLAYRSKAPTGIASSPEAAVV
jgi:membrane protease YdiL (CAAX protease family)